MHPVIAHFLDPKAVRSALEKSSTGQTMSEVEQLFATAAAAHPDRRARALRATPSGDLDDQQAALALAVFAALAVVEKDPALAPIITEARRALLEAGATEEDVQQFLSLVLLEEAFGFEDEADEFDSDLVAETFRTLPRLAALDEERVSALEEKFVHNAPAATRPLLLATIEALFSAAWSDGPVPLSPEHVEAALEQVRDQTSDADFETAVTALVSLLQMLSKEGLIGGQRLKRLNDAVKLSARSLRAAAAEGEDDDEDDESDGLDGEEEDDTEEAGEPLKSDKGTRN